MKKQNNFRFALWSMFIFITLSHCTDPKDCCVIIDTAVRIHYQDSTGKNLINSRPEYSESNIKLYYKNNSTFEYAYTSNLDNPKHFRIDPDSASRLILTIFPLNYHNQNQAITLIELNPNVVDTLVCTFDTSNGNQIVTNAKLNGVEMENRFLVVRK